MANRFEERVVVFTHIDRGTMSIASRTEILAAAFAGAEEIVGGRAPVA